jgi:hypothetical protein
MEKNPKKAQEKENDEILQKYDNLALVDPYGADTTTFHC